jgi:hypothetical protein
MPNFTTKDTRGAGYPTFGVLGPVKDGASTGRGGFGFDSSNNPNFTDDAGNVVASTATNAFVVNGEFRIGSSTTKSAAGTVQANATAVNSTISVVTGAANAGVILPSTTTGDMYVIYNAEAANGIKVWAPVGSTMNGSANGSVNIEGNSLALFVAYNSNAWGAIFTLNS